MYVNNKIGYSINIEIVTMAMKSLVHFLYGLFIGKLCICEQYNWIHHNTINNLLSKEMYIVNNKI